MNRQNLPQNHVANLGRSMWPELAAHSGQQWPLPNTRYTSKIDKQEPPLARGRVFPKHVATTLLLGIVGSFALLPVWQNKWQSRNVAQAPEIILCEFCRKPFVPSMSEWPLHPDTYPDSLSKNNLAQTPHESPSIEKAQD